MPKGSYLSCLDKRELLNQPAASVETLMRWGEFFHEAGMFHDAMDFYEKAGAQEPAKRLMTQALEEGDLFLFKRACKALKIDPDGDQWLTLGKEAKGRGLLLFAAEAFRQAGVEDDVPEATMPE